MLVRPAIHVLISIITLNNAVYSSALTQVIPSTESLKHLDSFGSSKEDFSDFTEQLEKIFVLVNKKEDIKQGRGVAFIENFQCCKNSLTFASESENNLLKVIFLMTPGSRFLVHSKTEYSPIFSLVSNYYRDKTDSFPLQGACTSEETKFWEDLKKKTRIHKSGESLEPFWVEKRKPNSLSSE
ncbi:MAG: hypothetical protein LBI26_02460 [Holosporales bacterium]|jgi:hypothetical protein|nr:hypothetical protein [Holosporales bacterium]